MGRPKKPIEVFRIEINKNDVRRLFNDLIGRRPDVWEMEELRIEIESLVEKAKLEKKLSKFITTWYSKD